jgi:hypothetical protein
MNNRNIEYKIKKTYIWQPFSVIANKIIEICWRLTYGLQS